MASNFSAEEKESRGKSFLEHYVKDRKIFIDTCSLLSKGADRFWEHVIPLLHQYHNKIIIPLRVVEELQKHQKNTAKPQLAEDANHSLRQLQQLLQAGYVEIRGEASDNFADNVFQTVFTKFRMQYKLLLITQDNDLAKDILNLNKQKSVRANPVQVLRINPYGYLNVFQWSRSKKPLPTTIRNRKRRITSRIAFSSAPRSPSWRTRYCRSAVCQGKENPPTLLRAPSNW